MLVLIADGLHNSVPEVSSLESALGLAGTITALILFVRALRRGSGPLGRADAH
jgi:hypothetical protein